jgi:hypothetical protein
MRPQPRDPIQLEMDAGDDQVIADCAAGKGISRPVPCPVPKL